MTLTIDPEFKDLIPPLTSEEFDELQHKMSTMSLPNAAALVGELLSARKINRNQASYLRGMRCVEEKEARKEESRRRQLKKQSWIDNARSEFIKTPKCSCFICHDFQPFCHAHHVLPLSIQYDKGFQRANHKHVWLCPTHHDIVHRLLALIDSRSQGEDTLSQELFQWMDNSKDADMLLSIFKMGTEMLSNAIEGGNTL